MAGFKLEAFRGIRPRISARKLPAGEAQTASNVRLGSGDLRPWYAAATDQALDDVDRQTIHLYDNDGTPIWFEWDTDVDVARGPVKDDTLERVYYTDGTYPKMTYRTIANTAAPYPSDFRRLGLPAPGTAPSVSATAIPDTTVGNTLTLDLDAGTDTMTADHFFLTILNSIWEDVNGTTTPEDERVYIKETLGTDMPIDIGIEVGDVYTVTVVDANNFTLTNTSSDYLSKSSRPTSPRDGSEADTALVMVTEGGGGANFAGYVHAPNAIEVAKTAHGLFNNSQVIVRSIGVTPRWRYSTGASDTPTGTLASEGDIPYFLIDYPDTGPYPSGPDNTELSTHECTFNDAGDHFDIFGNFTLEVIDDGDGSAETVEERAYVYTWVTFLGEEGPPSPVSAFVEVIDGETVTVGTFATAPASVDKYDVDYVRIYRTNTAEDPTEDDSNFQFVAEIAVATASYADEVLNEDLGELLPSAHWDQPDANMRGIVALSNGMMAGFYGKNVYLCEPYFPHAWPAIYDQAVDYDIVSIVSIGNSAVILTDGHPYIMSGTHPRNVSIRPYKINQACVSKRSAVEKDDRAIYASPDGLVELGIDGYKIITEEYFTKNEWTERAPSSIVAEVHDDKYFAFHTDGGFVFSHRDPSIGFSELEITIPLTLANFDADIGWSFSGSVATLTDGLFVGFGASGNTNDLSPDGITWSAGGVPVSYDNFTYNSDLEKFVAVRSFQRVQFSDDAITWTAEVPTTGATINTARSLEFYAELGLMVMGGDSEKIFTSTDGIAWTLQLTGGTSAGLSYQAFNPAGPVVLVFPSSSSSSYYRSVDGITWTTHTNPYGAAACDGVVWDDSNEVFVLVDGGSASKYSSDGLTWSNGGAMPTSVSVGGGQIAYNPILGRVLVTEASGGLGGYSDDGGQTWTGITHSLAQGELNYGNGLFVMSQASNYATKTSPDGITWTSQTRTDRGTLAVQKFTPTIVAYRDIVSDTTVELSEGDGFNVQITVTSTEGEVRAGIAWYDVSDALISTEYSDDTLSAPGTLSFTAVAPANTTYAKVVVSAYGDTVVSSASIAGTIVDTFLDIENDVFYYTDGTSVFEWEGDTANKLEMTWKSGQIHMNAPVNMGAAIVEADAYPVTFKLYGDGTLRATRTVADDEPFRLPGGYLASTYEVEIVGDESVTEVKVAESLFELAEG